MARAVSGRKSGRAPSEAEDTVTEAHRRFDECLRFESTARSNARDDVRFVEGDAYNNWQWPGDVLSGRRARVNLTINKTRQHCLQIINDCQQNQMGIKVNGVGFGSTDEAAEAIEGIIRHVEYAANAQQNAYKNAIRGQVQIGIGWIHITADYIPGRSFDQEISIKSVPDPLSVYSDPGCREPDHSDMRWAMVGETMARDEFRAAYPDHAELEGVQVWGDDRGGGGSASWSTKDEIRVMRYYRRSEKRETIWAIPANLAGDPKAAQTPGATKVVPESTMAPELLTLARQAGWPTRSVASPVVEWFDIAGREILDRGETPFDHVPLVPFIGEESLVDNQFDRKGHVRALIDPQRMYNYSASRYVEFVALQARSPYLAPSRAIEGHEDTWEAANDSDPPAVLTYNDQSLDDGSAIAPPVRIDPPAVDAASLQGMAQADQQMQMVSGQYEATLGAPGNERSGAAIQQRQRQSDRSTYHFTDNQGAALRLAGKIIISAIPRVYDTPRAVQILNLNGERQGVIVDPRLQGADGQPAAHQLVQPPMVPASQPGAAPGAPPAAAPAGQAPMQPAPDPNDPSSPLEAILAVNPLVGKYDVEADVGPAYATRRQESFNAIMQVVTGAPSLMPLISDLLFQAADFPLHDEIAERLRRMVPPQAMGESDPQAAALQGQIGNLQQHLSAVLEQLAQERQSRQIDQQKADAATAATKVKQYEADTERLAALGSLDPAAIIPVIRETIQQALTQQGINAPVQLAHPHDPSMGGPPPGHTVGPAGELVPLPSTNPPGGMIRDPDATR